MSSNPHAVVESKIQRRKVNVFCAAPIHTELLGPICLSELTVTLVVYLDVLEEFIMTILEEEGPNENYSILRVCTKKVGRDFLDRKFPRKWIGEGALMRPLLLRGETQRMLVVYRRFATAYRFHRQGSSSRRRIFLELLDT
jgi:hypothetical protein